MQSNGLVFHIAFVEELDSEIGTDRFQRLVVSKVCLEEPLRNIRYVSCTVSSILETHYKTIIVGVSFVITVGGWFAWNAFMSGVYSDNLSPYDVKGGFAHGFGTEWAWWLTLIVTLAALATIEAVHKACRRYLVAAGMWPPWKRKLGYNARDLDLGIWQEMEQDPEIAAKLKELAGDGYGDTSTETQAESAEGKEEV